MDRYAVSFDLSNSTLIKVSGEEAVSFLDGLFSNDIASLKKGGSCRALLLDRFGKVRHLVRVYCFGHYFILVARGGQGVDILFELTKKAALSKAVISNVTLVFSLLSFQGPKAGELTEGLVRFPASRSIAGGFDVFCSHSEKAELLGKAERGSEDLLETVRIEAGILEFGTDVTNQTLASENGLGDCISYTKGCFVGQEVVARMKNLGGKAPFKYVGLTCGSPMTVGGKVLGDGVLVGIITSACKHPAKGNLAIARIKNADFSLLTSEGIELKLVFLPGIA